MCVYAYTHSCMHVQVCMERETIKDKCYLLMSKRTWKFSPSASLDFKGLLARHKHPVMVVHREIYRVWLTLSRCYLTSLGSVYCRPLALVLWPVISYKIGLASLKT